MLWVREDEEGADRNVDLNQPPLAEHHVTSMRDGSAQSPATEAQSSQLIRLLWRRRRLVFTIATVGTMAATVIGLLVPPKYTATAQLVVQPQAETADERPLSAPETDEIIDTHATLLRSRDHLRHVIESLPEYYSQPQARAGEASAAQSTGLDELRRRLYVWSEPFRWSNDTAGSNLKDIERHAWIERDRRSRVISVAVTSPNPDKAAAVANRIVQLYVDGLIKQKQAYLSGELAKLEQQITEAKSEMNRTGTLQRRLAIDRHANSEGREADELHAAVRNAGVLPKIYSNLLERTRQLRYQQETVIQSIKIRSLAAVPDLPSSLNPILFILPAFVVFAIGGSWLAVLLEQLDRGLRSERDVSESLGITCIGLMPQLPGKRAARPEKYLLSEPYSAYTAAIRSAVAGLQLAAPTRACKVVLVSSSVPGEGKTTLARSLAARIAQLGQRVLLLDLDFQHGSPLGGLAGGANITIADRAQPYWLPAEFIQNIAEVGFDYLPVPRNRLDSVAVFASNQTPHPLHQLRETYNCVIIDGPPVLGVAEARLLPTMADMVLFVVRWGSTRRDLAQNALNLLSDAAYLDRARKIIPIGIVTQVDLKKHARYCYGDVGECIVKYGKYYAPSTETALQQILQQIKQDWRQLSKPVVPGNETDRSGA